MEYSRILTAQKDEVPSQKREAQKFLLRLDDERFAEMITNMDNGSITGKAYPASLLAEAYSVARLWVTPSQKKAVTTSRMKSRRQFQDEKQWRPRRPWGGWSQHGRARRKRLAKEREPTT